MIEGGELLLVDSSGGIEPPETDLLFLKYLWILNCSSYTLHQGYCCAIYSNLSF